MSNNEVGKDNLKNQFLKIDRKIGQKEFFVNGLWQIILTYFAYFLLLPGVVAINKGMIYSDEIAVMLGGMITLGAIAVIWFIGRIYMSFTKRRLNDIGYTDLSISQVRFVTFFPIVNVIAWIFLSMIKGVKNEEI